MSSGSDRGRPPLFRLALLGCALGLALLSCARDVTSPGANARFARGIAWQAQFPPAYLDAGVAASNVVSFSSVRVVLHHSDGTIAIDTVVAFPSTADSLPLTLNVQLLPSAPSSGEPLSLNLAYINATGDTVFRGGPVTVTAVPAQSAGSTPTAPVNIPVSYTGTGAGAVGVQISPRTGAATNGGTFTFTAVAVDGTGAVVPGTPIVWTSLDTSLATVPSPATGTALAANARGTARIVAQLLTGPSDQVTLAVQPHATAIAAQSGFAQSALAGTLLANPLVAVVTASDGLGVGGVTVSFAVTAGGGSVGSATAVTNSAGVAQTTWTLGSTVGAQTVTASVASITGSTATFSANAKSATATKLAITSTEASAVSNTALTPLKVVVQTAAGDTASSFTGLVTVALSGGNSGATLGGTTTANAVAGVATFANLMVDKSGTGYVLTASSTGLTAAASNTFNITAGAATTLSVVGGGGQTAVVGATLPTPIAARVTDAAGNGVAGTTVTFTVTSGGGAVGPLTAISDANGLAVTAWTLGSLVGTQSLTATAAGLVGSPQTISAIATAAPAGKLAITTQPVSNTAGVVLAAVVVTAQDAGGNVATTFTGPMTVALGTTTSGAVLSGTLTVNAVAGVATFSTLSINKSFSGYTLVASAASLTSAATSAFNIAAGAAASIASAGGTGQSGPISAALPTPIAARITDANGNGVAGTTVTFATTNGSVAPTSAVSDVNGLATTTWTLGATVGTQSLTATASGLTNSPLTITATGTAVLPHFAVTTSPAASQVAGTTVTPGFVVSALDVNNNPIPSFTGTVTLAIANNPGGATLGGTASVSAVAGVATFNTFSLNKVGTGYTLSASATGYTSGISAAFNVTAGAAAAIAISTGNNQSAALNAALSAPLSVLVTDANGNVVAGTAVHFAVATGGGSVNVTSATSNASGIATTNWTLGATLGAQTVTATSTGLTGSSLTFTATGLGTVVSTTVTPHLDTLTAIGATFALAAQGKDGAGNNAAGTFTWASRTPVVATVNTAGLVTGATNGSAWIVATETGGTKDSALIVVQQQVATINVIPGNRNIYLGANFTFTAQAVDGRNNPLAAQPTFTWSSTIPSFASVNSSGLVTALALGATQIRATSGTITGVSNVNIITAIQHIYVVRDSAGFSTAASDTFNMAALLLHRAYKAYAYDTLNAQMSGITFTWATSNSSVAGLDTTQSSRADALSAANGNAFVQASAQGVTGAALLNVQQVLTSIAITPASPSVAPNGSIPLTARGKDSNGQFISGGTFTWAASNGFATVNSSGVVVAGASTGVDSIKALSASPNVVSPWDVVAISNSVPAALSFSRDTVSVGRGSSTSVPILLSKTSATPVTLLLTVADTFAFWSSTKVTVPPNTPSINVQLNGHNAGTTTITVTDSAGVYAPKTSVVAVQASMQLATGSLSLNASDQVSTQVVLSDPSPAGGTFVTFSYSTPGVASVSPSPAFVPAGQLAANIVITAVAAGTTSITPVATGVNGSAASFTTYAPVLSFSSATDQIGAGQYDPNINVRIPTYTVNPVPLTFTSSDTTKVTVTPSATIPGGAYYVYPTLTAKAPGTATITVTAPGWTAGNQIAVTVTTPRVGVCCGGNLTTTSPAQGLTIYAEDSVGNTHVQTSSLVVHVSSSDTTVLKVLDTLVSIAPGSYYNNSSVQVIPGGAGGTAYLRVTSSGAFADSSVYTVVGPKLAFSWSTSRVGLGEEDDNVNVQVPNSVLTPLVVTLTADTTVTGIPASVTIPAGTYYAQFNVRGKALGTVPIYATAPGYQADTATYTITSPRLYMCCGTTLNNFSGTQSFTVYSEDSVGSTHIRTTPLAVQFTSTNPAVLTVDTGVTIAAGTYYANTQHVTPVGVGTAMVIATAAGTPPDTVTYTVTTPAVNIDFGTYTIGTAQHQNATDFVVYVPNTRTSPLPVTITHNHPAVATLTTLLDTIPTGNSQAYISLAGLTPGLDTVVVSAPGYKPDTSFIRVTTPRLGQCCMPGSATTTTPPFSLTVYAEDSLGTTHYASDTIAVHVVSSDTTVIKPSQAYSHIPLNAYYNNTTTINVMGPGTANITFSDSAGVYLPVTTGSINVTGPSLSLSVGSTVLGMRQNSGPSGGEVYTANNVLTPLVVNLVSTGTSVVTVPATVTIPAGLNYAYFQVTAQDTVGTIQIQATATGYSGANQNVQVTQPKFAFSTSTSANTTSPQQVITVYAEDANGTTHYTNENVTVMLASSAPSVANVDSASVTITAGSYYNNLAHWLPLVVGTAQLSATDQRAPIYHYNTATTNLTVNEPTLTLGNFNTLGIGQYADNYFYVQTPDNQANPLVVTLTHPGTAFTTAPATVTIASGTSFSYFRLVGLAAGVDTLVASATSPAHNPATGFTTVGNGRLDPLSGWPSGSLAVGDSSQVTLYVRDPNQTVRNVLASTTFTLTAGANVEFVSGGVSSAVITSATVPAAAQSVTFYIKAIASGTASSSISAANYTTYSNTVTVP